MQIEKTAETKITSECDQLIAYLFKCDKQAAWLVARKDSVEYAIMCEKHKRSFETASDAKDCEFHPYTLELNETLAKKANDHWQRFAKLNK